MDAILNAAEQILHRSGLPALRLARLFRELKAEVGATARTLDLQGLRSLLEARPDRFRVLDPWRGPWRFVRSAGTLEGADEGDAWVVAVRDSGDTAATGGEPRRAVRQLRESVRWLALAVDPHSPRHVARWKRLMDASLASGGRPERAA